MTGGGSPVPGPGKPATCSRARIGRRNRPGHAAGPIAGPRGRVASIDGAVRATASSPSPPPPRLGNRPETARPAGPRGPIRRPHSKPRGGPADPRPGELGRGSVRVASFRVGACFIASFRVGASLVEGAGSWGAGAATAARCCRPPVARARTRERGCPPPRSSAAFAFAFAFAAAPFFFRFLPRHGRRRRRKPGGLTIGGFWCWCCNLCWCWCCGGVGGVGGGGGWRVPGLL